MNRGLALVARLTAVLGLAVSAGCSTFSDTLPSLTSEPESCPPVVVHECPVCSARACPGAPVVERVVEKPVRVEVPVATTAGELNLPVVGAVEWATLEPPGVRLEARVDTGLEVTSVQVANLQELEKDGTRHVIFDLTDPVSGEVFPVETEVVRRISVKRGDSVVEYRYIVRLWVTVGDERSLIDINLDRRASSDYPLILGRNFLTDVAIVDVSRQHLLD